MTIDWVWFAEHWFECVLLLMLAVCFVFGVWRALCEFFWPL